MTLIINLINLIQMRLILKADEVDDVHMICEAHLVYSVQIVVDIADIYSYSSSHIREKVTIQLFVMGQTCQVCQQTVHCILHHLSGSALACVRVRR